MANVVPAADPAAQVADPSMMDPVGQQEMLEQVAQDPIAIDPTGDPHFVDPAAPILPEGVTMEQLLDTHQNFTQKTQALADERRQLEPLAELAQDLRSNIALQQHIANFYTGEVDAAALDVEAMRAELSAMQQQQSQMSQIAQLHKEVTDAGHPDFDDAQLLEYMQNTGIPIPRVAYRDMMFDKIGPQAAAALEAKIKQQGELVPGAQTPAPDRRAAAQSFNADDIASMSDEDFTKNFANIMKAYAG